MYWIWRKDPHPKFRETSHRESAKATDAAKYGIEELNLIDAGGGIICIDREGNIGYAYNTEVMTMHYIE